jgi:F0F1-type ATP synthase assembly protein I
MPYHRPIPDSNKPSKLSSGFQGWIQAEKLTQIAIVIPCAVLIGWAAGAWLDHHFHQKWFTLAGIVLGSIAGMTSAIRMAMAAGAARDNDAGSGDEGSGSSHDS